MAMRKKRKRKGKKGKHPPPFKRVPGAIFVSDKKERERG